MAEKCGTSKAYIQQVARTYSLPTPRKVDGGKPNIRTEVLTDRKVKSLEDDLKGLRAKNRELHSLLEEESELRQGFDAISQISTHEIEPKHGSKTSEAVMVMLASDWHVEERVDPKTVNGLNKYNPEIAKKCGDTFFRNGLRLTQIFQKDIRIETIILALLGDFFTNDIHEELAEINAMPPMEACRFAQDMIASGIDFLLDRFKGNLVIPCHSGNHARTTKDQRHATEAGHSLEFYMYHNLATYFRDEKRVQFIIPKSYLSYIDVYGRTVRFHHGHMVRYQGGVGGIYIPMNKALAQWDKSTRADLSCNGHFHQLRDGGNFVVNGSMIGWNAYGTAIKADYEEPKQACFLLDKKRGRTISAPILFDRRM